MQAAIYFQLLHDTAYSYDKPLLKTLKQHIPELVTFDFDTQSDRLVAGYATELLEKADKAIVIVELHNSEATGLVTFLEKVISLKNKCMVLLYGQHPLADKMLKLIDKDRLVKVHQEDAAVQQVIHFLSMK